MKTKRTKRGIGKSPGGRKAVFLFAWRAHLAFQTHLVDATTLLSFLDKTTFLRAPF